jgi:excisionase family DNA binding protein
VRTRPHPPQMLQLAAPPAAQPPQVVELRVQPESLLLTVEEAADMLLIGRSLMYELIRDGAVESIHIGRLRRVPREALSAYVAELGRRQPEPAKAI